VNEEISLKNFLINAYLKNEMMLNLKLRLPVLMIFLFAFVLVSCDPVYFGKTYIRNDSSTALSLQYNSSLGDTTIVIPAHSMVEIGQFSGMGSTSDFTCCPCEFEIYNLVPVNSSLSLSKDIANNNQWAISNQKAKGHSQKVINCQFTISPSDIQ
jgi:hypothetical protein